MMQESVFEFFPYASLRSGQREIMDKAFRSLSSGKTLMLEAPNGVGKTISALSAALAVARREGLKVLYLARTHKQLDRVMEELQEISKLQQVRGIALRGRKEMCVNSRLREMPIPVPEIASEACRALREEGMCPFYDKFVAMGSRIPGELIKNPLRARDFILSCLRVRVCPYEAARASLRLVDVMSMNYMYTFSKELKSRTLNKAGVDLGKTVVILDECHNVPEVSLSVMSSWLSENTIKRAIAEQMAFFGESEEILRSISSLINEYRHLADPEVLIKSEVLPAIFSKEEGQAAVERLRELGELVLRHKISMDLHPLSHSSVVRSFLQKLIERCERQDYALVLRRVPRTSLGSIALDPRSAFSELRREAFSILLMSGTVGDPSALAEEVGAGKFSSMAVPLFRGGRLSVYLTAGVTTSMRSRDPDSYRFMARVIGQTSEEVDGNLGVFTASYDVLRGLLEAGIEGEVEKPLFIERQGMGSSRNDEMIIEYKDWAEQTGAVLLGVQGGRNSEGEDYPGKEMSAVVVLGIPYARPTDSTGAKISFYETIFPGKGRYYAYALPAVRVAAQSAGRPMRGPEDDAFIVLADNRFLSRRVMSGLPSWIRERATKAFWGDVPRLARGFFGGGKEGAG